MGTRRQIHKKVMIEQIDINAGDNVVEKKSLQELSMPEVFQALKNAPEPPKDSNKNFLDKYTEWYYNERLSALNKI